MSSSCTVQLHRRFVPFRIWSWDDIRPHVHLLFLLIAALPLVHILHRLQMPLVWPWQFIGAFTFDVLRKSILAAALFWVLVNRGEWPRIVRRLREHPSHTMLFLLFWVVVELRSPGWHWYMFADSFVMLQFAQHKWEKNESVIPGVVATAVAGLYLMTAIFLAFTYNDVVVALRFYGGYDGFFQQLDLQLFGTTSSIIAHRASSLLPVAVFRFLEYVYESMFWVLGATVALCAVNLGTRKALQFSGAILIAQFLAVTLFFVWPSHGPYYSCPNHFVRVAQTLRTSQIQYRMLQSARLVWAHARLERLPFGYYLSFPCTHIAQPLIAAWFLRPWKSLMYSLAIYCVVLSSAVVLLEWHYLVDLLGGVAIAGAAAWSIGDLRRAPACEQSVPALCARGRDAEAA